MNRTSVSAPIRTPPPVGIVDKGLLEDAATVDFWVDPVDKVVTEEEEEEALVNKVNPVVEVVEFMF